MSREEREKMRTRVEVRRKQEDEQGEKVKKWKISRARQIFNWGGADVLEIRAGKAQDYFAMHGVPLADVATYAAENFRFHERSEYWQEAVYQGRTDRKRVKIKAGRYFPALHATVRNASGEVVGGACDLFR